MISNKNGYALIYILGVIALLILLVTSLTNFTMQRSFKVNQNVHDIKKIAEAEMIIESASMELINYFDTVNNSTNVDKLSGLIQDFEPKFLEIEQQYNVRILDLTQESLLFPINNRSQYTYDPDSFNWPLAIVYQDGDLIAQRRLFLSNIPSFLYFALGSRTDLTINGGAYIDGDIYADQNLYLSNSVNYIGNLDVYNEDTGFLSMHDESNVYVNQSLYSCSETPSYDCYDIDNDVQPGIYTKNTTHFIPIEERYQYDQTFFGSPPQVFNYNNRFLDVDIDASFLFYLKETVNQQSDTLSIDQIGSHLDDYILARLLYETEDLTDIEDQDQQSIVFKTDMLFNHPIEFKNEKWIIVDGDLMIQNLQTKYIPVDANLLITGNLTITGNVSFDSTIYVLGDTTIDNASIIGDNLNQLVLMSKGDIQFSKINSYIDHFSGFNGNSINPDIKGFFYSDKQIELFAVASYIIVEGGIFANDSENRNSNGTINKISYIPNTNDSIGLMVNAFRGQVKNSSGTLEFTDSNNYMHSRLVIKHSQDILINQPKGLPVNSKFNYLFDEIIIK